jgi:hypothetical protein
MRHDLNDQTIWIPPADGQVIEARFPPIKLPQNHIAGDSLPTNHAPRLSEAHYVGVDHNMNHVIKGAAFNVTATDTARAGDQPGNWVNGHWQSSWVPPIDLSHDSRCISSEQQLEAVCAVTHLAAVANATK